VRLQTVHLRVNDAATGKPTPVRLRVTDADNRYYAPLGRLADFALGDAEDVGGNVRLDDMKFSHIDGTCEIELPATPVLVEAYKGFEYRPVRQEVHLKPGQLSVRLSIERSADLRAEGWHSGDTRSMFLSPHGALLEAAAEDLALVHLLAGVCQRGNVAALPNLLAFSGQKLTLEMPGHAVAVNTFNTGPLGSLALLHCHRVVHPLQVERINWTLADWCDQCHRKGGLVVASMEELAESEALADVLLGRIDALEATDWDWWHNPANVWYDLLNCGFHVPLVGASAKNSNRQVLGAVRTYARLMPGEGWSHKGWIEAVRAGRTFVSSEPLLDFTVDGKGPGSTVTPESASINLAVHARGNSPIEDLELIQDGNVVLGGSALTFIETQLPVTGSGWWAARCRDAHTSPVYVHVNGASDPVAPTSLSRLQTYLKRFETRIDALASQGRFASAKDEGRLRKILDDANRKLIELAGKR